MNYTTQSIKQGKVGKELDWGELNPGRDSGLVQMHLKLLTKGPFSSQDGVPEYRTFCLERPITMDHNGVTSCTSRSCFVCVKKRKLANRALDEEEEQEILEEFGNEYKSKIGLRLISHHGYRAGGGFGPTGNGKRIIIPEENKRRFDHCNDKRSNSSIKFVKANEDELKGRQVDHIDINKITKVSDDEQNCANVTNNYIQSVSCLNGNIDNQADHNNEYENVNEYTKNVTIHKKGASVRSNDTKSTTKSHKLYDSPTIHNEEPSKMDDPMESMATSSNNGASVRVSDTKSTTFSDNEPKEFIKDANISDEISIVVTSHNDEADGVAKNGKSSWLVEDSSERPSEEKKRSNSPLTNVVFVTYEDGESTDDNDVIDAEDDHHSEPTYAQFEINTVDMKRDWRSNAEVINQSINQVSGRNTRPDLDDQVLSVPSFNTQTGGKVMKDIPETIRGRKEDAIYIMQMLNISSQECLTFYDSGANCNLIKGKLAEDSEMKLMDSTPVRLGAIANQTVWSRYGTYEFMIGPIKEDGSDVYIQAQGMDQITAYINKFELTEARSEFMEDLRVKSYIHDKEFPCFIGGTDVSLLIGLKNTGIMPLMKFRLPNGLAMFEAELADIFGSYICFGGTHESFTQTNIKGSCHQSYYQTTCMLTEVANAYMQSPYVQLTHTPYFEDSETIPGISYTRNQLRTEEYSSEVLDQLQCDCLDDNHSPVVKENKNLYIRSDCRWQK